MSSTEATDDRSALLGALASTLLPASGDWPSTDDISAGELIWARSRLLPTHREALKEFVAGPPESFFSGDVDARVELLRELERDEGPLFELLKTAVYDAYYTHPTVVAFVAERVDARPGPPQPTGHLPAFRLEPPPDVRVVRASGVRWRDDEEQVARDVRAIQQADPQKVWDIEEIAAWRK